MLYGDLGKCEVVVVTNALMIHEIDKDEVFSRGIAYNIQMDQVWGCAASPQQDTL